MDETYTKLQNKRDELGQEGIKKLEFQLDCINPDEAKYASKIDPVRKYLSVASEWRMCAQIQYILLETRCEFGQAPKEAVDKLKEALPKADPVNMKLLEDILNHDQIAVIKELGRITNEDIEALLHPGTTSYDILDTARSYLFKQAWTEEIRPAFCKTINKLNDYADRSRKVAVTGRTHLQTTSPITFGSFFANYAGQLAKIVSKLDFAFNDLPGKISGMVGTYAGIEMIIGDGKGISFEKAVLDKLGLRPDYTATQIVHKGPLATVGKEIANIAGTLGDLANNVTIYYMSAIEELTSGINLESLGLSSTDANKNNPINWEHIAGMVAVIQSKQIILDALLRSKLQRDLQSSVQARYIGEMLSQTYRIFNRASRALDNLLIVTDNVENNLEKVRLFPSEAMVTILRGEQFKHPEYGPGHDFVKEMSKMARKEKEKLINVALRDPLFKQVHENLPQKKKDVLAGKIEEYLGSVNEKININIEYARKICA